jgi:hypothetical protein
MLGPLDFSCLHGYPHEFHYELWKKHALRFYGNRDDSLLFVAFFMDFIEKFNFVYDDVIMKNVYNFHEKRCKGMI